MAKEPSLNVAPSGAKSFNSPDRYLAGCEKGTRVRLLVPIYDNVQRIEAGEEIFWPFDDPPLETTAVLASVRQTPLDAPAFTSGKPPADYIDPATGEPPVIESV